MDKGRLNEIGARVAAGVGARDVPTPDRNVYPYCVQHDTPRPWPTCGASTTTPRPCVRHGALPRGRVLVRVSLNGYARTFARCCCSGATNKGGGASYDEHTGRGGYPPPISSGSSP